MRSVAMVEPYSSGNMLAPAFRRAGFSPYAIILARDSSPNLATFRRNDFDNIITHDGNAIEPLIARLRPIAPTAIIPGTHTGVPLADQLAAVLTPHLANVPGLMSARQHKGDMVAAVAARGIPVIKTLCTRGAVDEIEDWIVREGLSGRDLVAKPSDSAGTDSVRFIAGGRDWPEEIARLIGSSGRYGSRVTEVIVQEHVKGTEYVVDTFSREGKHAVGDVAMYRKVSNRRHMAIYESMEFLSLDQPGVEEIVVYVKRVLDAVGFNFGAAHTEVMMTDRGPRLIEVNARLAGGGQPWVCQLATGSNSIDQMVQYLLGSRDIRDYYTLEMAVLVIFFSVRSAGVVSNLSRLDDINDLESCFNLQVNVRDGDYVPETSDIFDAQGLGTVVLAHSDPAQVHADHLEVRRIASSAGRPGGFVTR